MNQRINIITPAGPDTRAYAFNEDKPDIDALRQPRGESWASRSERDYLARSHPGPSGAERAAEQRLWEQVSGKAPPAAQVSPQLGAVFQATRPQPSRKEVELESRLFEQVSASGGFQPELG